MSNKGMYFLMEVVGLILLGYFAFSDMVFFEKLLGLLLSVFLFGYPISMNEDGKKKKLESGSVEFEKLKPGSYLFMTTPVPHINCSPTGECTLYFAFLEYSRNGKAISVVIGTSAKIEIQNAMRGKFINQIKNGEGLEIDKDHNITEIEI